MREYHSRPAERLGTDAQAGKPARDGKRSRRVPFDGAGGGIRTPDLWFTKPLLYQLSYAGAFSKSASSLTIHGASTSRGILAAPCDRCDMPLAYRKYPGLTLTRPLRGAILLHVRSGADILSARSKLRFSPLPRVRPDRDATGISMQSPASPN